MSQTAVRTDEAVRAMLLSRAQDAHRLATWILHDPVAAEDAVQEAALVAWQRRRELRRVEAAEGWFNRILVNVCRSELRRRRREPRIAEPPPDSDAADRQERDDLRDPTDHAERWVARDELTSAILRLEPEEQLLVALRYGRDLTVPQIAAATGFREGTVKSRLHYALNHLRAELEAARRGPEAKR